MIDFSVSDLQARLSSRDLLADVHDKFKTTRKITYLVCNGVRVDVFVKGREILYPFLIVLKSAITRRRPLSV